MSQFLKVEGLRDEADRAKRECLEVKKIAEEKEILFKQEQAALRKVRYNSWLPRMLNKQGALPL